MNKYFIFILLNLIAISCLSQLQKDELKTNSAEDWFNLYQNSISNLRGGSCPMYPSCANYTLEIIKEKGIIQGVINGSDRLLRCGHEHNYYNLTLQDKGFKLLDLPIENIDLDLKFKTKKYYYSNKINYEDSLLNEIALLINSGNISEAIILINRYKISNKIQNPNIIELEFICLNSKKEFEKVIYQYDLLDDVFKKNTNILKQYFISCFNIENYNAIIKEQIIIFNSLKTDSFLSTRLSKYVFVSYLSQNKYNDAENYIEKAFINQIDKDAANNTLVKLNGIKKKSPLIAKSLSIILPGMGYIYAGHFTTGISSLLINSLIGFASYSSFKSGNAGMGILSGLIELGFYIGNIQGSGRSIERENTYYKNSIIKEYTNQSFIN